MAQMKIRPLDAAHILLNTRDAILEGRSDFTAEEIQTFKDCGLKFTGFQKVTEDRQNVAAGVLKEKNILVVTGSQVRDYPLYNLRPNRSLSWRTEQDEIKALLGPWKIGDFHSGFVLHAARALKFLDGHTPDAIVGHSLGAASAQILGNHFNVPTVCLAPPQVIKKARLQTDDMRKETNSQWKVLNVAWRQDTVTSIARPLGFRCLGHRVVFVKANMGIDHFVTNYLEMIEDDPNNVIINSKGERGSLPDTWYTKGLPIADNPK